MNSIPAISKPTRTRRKYLALLGFIINTVLCSEILLQSHQSRISLAPGQDSSVTRNDIHQPTNDTASAENTTTSSPWYLHTHDGVRSSNAIRIDATTRFYQDIRFSTNPNGTIIITNQVDDWSRIDETTPTPATETAAAKRRPWCIFHVGPPKMASTAIQQHFTEFADETFLTQDNYTYSGLCWRNGRFCHRGKFLLAMNHVIASPTCVKKLVAARRKYNMAAARDGDHENGGGGGGGGNGHLYNVLYQVDCAEFKRLVDMLHDLHSRGMSLIFSEEQMSNELDKYIRVWRLLQEATMPNDSWNFGILVGYRRWMDYLPSRHWQDELNARGWYNWVGEGENHYLGRHIRPLFPTHNGVDNLGKFTDTILSKLRRNQVNIPIRIFNMNAVTPTSSLSLRSLLFCHLIPHMATCCQQSLLRDSGSINNTGKTKLPGVVGAATSFDYDMLAVAAKEAGLLQPNLERRNVADAARKYHKSSGATSSDFAKICPSKTEMDVFLNISLAKERAIMPALHEHPLFGQDQHQENFWKAVEQKKYCTIDVNATLQQDEWNQFFANLQP